MLMVLILNFTIPMKSYSLPGNSLKTPRESSLSLNVGNIDTKSVELTWSYANDLKFFPGDYLNLVVIDEEAGEKGDTPVLSIYEGKDGKSIKDIKSFKAENLCPGRKYKVLLEVRQYDGASHISEGTFETKSLVISNMKVHDAKEDRIDTKKIKVSWGIEPDNFKLSKGDKIQIYLKRLSDNDFFREPIFETEEDVKSANIELPHFQEMYDFIIVYVVGGHKITSDIFFVDVMADDLNFEVQDIKTSSAKFTWTYPNEDLLGGDSSVNIFLKEESDIDYSEEPIHTISGKDELLKIKEYLASKLKYETKYKVRARFSIENLKEFDKDNPVYTEKEYEFTTGKFNIKDFKATTGNDNKVKLTWDFEGENIYFSEGDSLGVYIKEIKDKEYGDNLLKDETIKPEEMATKKEAEISLPKYRTKFNIKLVYSIGGKYITKYTTSYIDIPKIDFGIKVESGDKLKVKLTFDQEKTKFKESDKIELFVKKFGDDEGTYKPIEFKENPRSVMEDKDSIITKELTVENIKEAINSGASTYDSPDSPSPETYSLKIKVTKDGDAFQEEIHKVLMEKDFLQITRIDYVKIDEKKIKATVKYSPYDFEFDDKVKSLTYTKEKVVEKASFLKKFRSKGDTGEISNGELKTKNSFEIPFEDYGKYKLLFRYEMTYKTLPSYKESEADGELDADTVKPDVKFEDVYDNKFDVFGFDIVDDVFNEIRLGFSFEPHYKPKEGDRIDIYFKSEKKDKTEDDKETQSEYSTDPLATFIHDGTKVDLSNIGTVDLAGLDANTKYEFKAKFTPKSGTTPTEKTREAETLELKIKEIKTRHIANLAVDINWVLEEGFNFGPNDTLDVYYKDDKSDYKKDPNESFDKLYLSNGVTIFVDTIDTDYKVKLIFKSGVTSFEKELQFKNTVEDIEVEIHKAYETSAYLKWKYPKNYNLTDGESISIFVKTKDGEYDDEPDYYLEQNEKENQYVLDFRSIKLVDLMPDTEYDVKVLLDFGDVGKKKKEVSFKTDPVEITDIKIKYLSAYEFDVKWSLNKEGISFDPEYDSLKVYMKKSSSGDFSDDDLMYEISEGINEYYSSNFIPEDLDDFYDVKVEYNLGGKKIDKKIEAGTVLLEIDEDSHALNVKYPKGIDFSDSDKVDVLKYSEGDEDYESIGNFTTGLNGEVPIDLSEVPGGSNILVLTENKECEIYPCSIDYGEAGEAGEAGEEELEFPPIEIVSELYGTWIDLTIPEYYNIDTSGEVLNSIGGDSYFAENDDGEFVIVIERLVPKKTYKGAFIVAYDSDGNEVKFSIGEFTLEASTLLEEFLFNSYYFAFEREPDEGGYNYWADELMKKGDITGKFFLINLMFAEREFADRNLSDSDLVKALYQIVVNRQYDEQGLNYWIGAYGEYLQEFNGDKYEAKKKIVLRMAYEPEFRNLCEKMDIIW